MNKYLKAVAGFCLLGVAVLIAADNIGSSSGVIREQPTARWQLARVATTATSLTSVTNTVLAKAGIVRRILILGGSGTDVVEIHNAASITTATAANETFQQTTNTSLRIPINVDLAESWDHSTGITTVLKPGDTTVVMRVWISYDQNR